MIGRATRELQTGDINIEAKLILSPAYWSVRSAIVEALAPFPEARKAVLDALRDAHTEPKLIHGQSQ